MLTELHKNPEKRVLKKVRRDFLSKKTESDDTTLVDPAAEYLTNFNFHTLSAPTGLVEKNRKILIGPEYLNNYYKILNALPIKHFPSNIVVLNLTEKKAHEALPWEYSAKRLESYGDLELATWAHRITKYRENYPKLMTIYYEKLKSEDPQILEDLKTTKIKAQQACSKIESSYPYYKAVHYLRRDECETAQLSYSEAFLKEMGHSVESFLSWTQKYGVPATFDDKCSVFLQILKKYFDGESLLGSYVQEGDEFETILLTSKKLEKKFNVQFVNVIEPDPQDPILHAYFIIKDKPYHEKELMQSNVTIKKTKQKKVEVVDSEEEEISEDQYE